MTSTNFVFTLNNPTVEEKELARSDPPPSPIRFMGFEEETGTEGTPHLQGFAVLKKRKTISGAKLIPIFKRAHVEVMKGRLDQSEVYCSKEGNLECFGDRPKSSKQKGTDEQLRWETMINLATVGKWEELKANYPKEYVAHYNKWKSIAKDHMKPPAALKTLENLWVHGPTGTGKTRYYRELYPDAYLKDADTKWWDGYDPDVHSTVIIDDFDKYHIKQGYHLKIWADHHPFKAETKGGAMMIRPLRIIVTSNYCIEDIWDDSTTTEPLKRRFKEELKDTIPPLLTITPNDHHSSCAPNFDVTYVLNPTPTGWET